MEFVRTIFRSLFEGTTIPTNFLNKEVENFKIRPNHSMPKGMNAA